MKFQESTGSSIMTDEQNKWARFNMMIWMSALTPSEDVVALDLKEASAVKQALSPIVHSGYFESILSFLIVTNVSLLMAEHFPQVRSPMQSPRPSILARTAPAAVLASV